MAEAKAKPEVTAVTMEDGRVVNFVGKRRIDKDYLIDESKVQADENGVYIAKEAIQIRLDFINGKTASYFIPPASVAQHAGHGGVQKTGDEAAGEKDIDDAYEAISELVSRLSQGEWSVQRESGGFAGASVVIRALMEATGQTQEKVRAFLDQKLEQLKAATPEGGKAPSRAKLYESFRNPKTKVGQIIARMEEEKRSKDTIVDADAEMEALKAA